MNSELSKWNQHYLEWGIACVGPKDYDSGNAISTALNETREGKQH